MYLALSSSPKIEDVRNVMKLGFEAIHLKFSYRFNYDTSLLGALKCSVHAESLFGVEELKTKANGMVDYLKEAVDFCEIVGSSDLSFHPPYIKDFDWPLQNDIVSFKIRYSDLLKKSRIVFDEIISSTLKYSKEKGVRLAVESFCYPPFIFENLRTFYNYCKKHENLGFLVDVSHLYQFGIDLDKAIRLFGKDLRGIHLSDARRTKGLSALTVKRDTHLPVGKGEIDFHELVTVLRDIEYDSFLAFEIRGKLTDVMKSKMMMEKMLLS